MIAKIPVQKPWQFTADDNGKIDIPENIVELASFLETLWTKIFDNNEQDQIKLYNKAALKYNKLVTFQAITIIDNFKKQEQINMATKKAAAEAASKKATPAKAAGKTTVSNKKAAPAKAAAAKKAVPAKKGTVAKATTAPGEKKVFQKVIVAELAEKGLSINEIVEQTGIKKTNVAWFFSKLKLGKKKQ